MAPRVGVDLMELLHLLQRALQLLDLAPSQQGVVRIERFNLGTAEPKVSKKNKSKIRNMNIRLQM
jgi:hypothetical protein